MTSSLCSLANATTRLKKSRSTTWVVGLCGKERIIIFGRGHIVLIARSARSTKSPSPLVREIDRTSAPAMITEKVWIGYVGLGTSAMSPGPIVASTRWDSPSFAPIVAIASVSGSRSTLYFRLYQLQMASRSFGIPRDRE